MDHKRLSGGARKKIQQEKKKKESVLLESVPNISSFFSTKTSAESNSINATANSAKVSNAPELACSSQDPETTTSVDTEPNASDAYDSTNSAVASCSDECEVTAPLDSIENELNLSSTPSTVTTLPSDPAKWAETLTESMKEVLIQRGAKSFHNRHSHYPASVRNSGLGGKTRCLNNEHFTSHLPNGQRVQREWLMYSPSTGNVYCFACKLFSPKTHSFVTGYCDWKHSERFGEHERSAEHITCMQAVLNRAKGATVDADLFKQFQAESSYWRQVLQRVVAVIKFLAERGLAFRGKNESLGSPLNGNYLGILEVLAEFDPFLKDHIRKFGQMGRGNTSYLSSTICEEFIELMGAKTKQAIADELQASKYYSIIVDSTPDLSHVDQLTFIFRFVSKEGSVVERFVGFEPITSHTGESLANCVMSVLENLGLELSNCRGQAYDNASNMSGRYNGLQAHLKKSNPLIHYIPCAAHSLNLVGVNSIDRCGNEVSKYFDLIQSIYNFTTASTHRWDRVFGNSNIDLTLKALSNTRWSCRAESTKALWQNYSKIKAALQVISTDDTEKRDTRTEADSLVRKLDSLEMAFMAGFWDTVLSRFQATSLQLQKADMDLGTAVRLLESLRTFVLSQRDLFDHFEQKALNMLGGTPSYRAERTRKRKKFADESASPDVVLEGRQLFQIETFIASIDQLSSSLNHRLEAYKHLNNLFSVLFSLDTESNASVLHKAKILTESYPSDLNESLGQELIQFKSFIQLNNTDEERTPSGLLKTIIHFGLQPTFPNTYIALQIFLTLPVSNCEGERSFSLLSRVKNELRTRMTQKRLNALSLMAIESELTRELDFNDVVDDFAKLKARKKPLA